MQENKAAGGFTREEAKKMGYDWNVVQFFLKENQDLLGFIWGNLSPLYQSILKNTISNKEVLNYIGTEAKMNFVLDVIAPMDDPELSHNQSYSYMACLVIAKHRRLI